MRDSIILGYSNFGYYSFDGPTEIKYYYVRSSDNVQNKSEPSEVVELKPYVEILGYNYLIDTTTEIDPSFQGLNVPSNATIPNDITKLRQLKHIRLGGYNLSGEIPSELWNLPALYEIDLSNNQLTGQFPTNLTLTDPSSIRWIVLNNNQLSGNIDFIGNFTNLIMLRLYNNEFSGVIPEAICTNWAGGSTYGSEWFELGNNNLCPPYPSCFYSSSSQNTADCN